MNPWLRRLFALLLFAYPRDFRTSYATTMREHFESEMPGWGDVFVRRGTYCPERSRCARKTFGVISTMPFA